MKVSYDDFKGFIGSRKTDVLMIERSDRYHIFTVDEAINIEAMVVKGTEEATDFEDNLKSKCNTDKFNRDEMIYWGKYHEHIDGSQYLQTPKSIQIQFPNDYGIYNFFGSWIHVEDFGADDYIRFKLVDIDNILGYGAGVVLKQYCELWCKNIAKTEAPIYAPNKSAGKVMQGLYAVFDYYASDATKTDIKLWGKLVVTVDS